MGNPIKQLVIEERALNSAKSEVNTNFRKDPYNLDTLVTDFYGAGKQTDETSRVMDALSACFSLEHIMSMKLPAHLPQNNRKVFSAMYGLNLGASEGLDKLDMRLTRPTIRHRKTQSPSPFMDVRIDPEKYHPNQRHQFMLTIKNALSNKRLRQTRSLTEVCKDYFEFVKDSTYTLLSRPEFQEDNRFVNSLEVHYDGKIVRGLEARKAVTRKKESRLSWDMIAGYKPQKEFFNELSKLIKNDDVCKKVNPDVRIFAPNILLYGPPGTGKSTMVEIFADSLNAPVTKLSLSDLTDTYMDASAIKLQEFFDEATGYIRAGDAEISVMYMDEMDVIGVKRDSSRTSDDSIKVVTTLLNNLDDINQIPGFMFIGSTNRPLAFSKALIDRIDHKLPVPAPDVNTQQKILDYYIRYNNGLSQYPLFDGVDTRAIAEYSTFPDGSRFVGRDFKHIFRKILFYKMCRVVDGNEDEVINTAKFKGFVDAYKIDETAWRNEFGD